MLGNIDFLVSSIIVLIILYYHSSRELKMDNHNNRIFRYFLILSIFDLIFDMITSFLMAYPVSEFVWLSVLSLTIFYYLQVFITYSIALYAISLRDNYSQNRKKWILAWGLLPALMLLFITGNIFGKYIFSFDSVGVYSNGYLYPVMYIYYIIYTLIIIGGCLFHRKDIDKNNALVIYEAIFIGTICTLLQFLIPGYMLTGFGISLGILIVFLKINHPGLYIDPLTNTYNQSYFNYWYSDVLTRNKDVHLIAIELSGLKRTNLLYGMKKGDDILIQVAKWLKEQTHCLVFRTSGNRFVLGTFSINDYYTTVDLIENVFIDSPGNKMINSHVCAIDYAQTKFPSNTIMAYLDYLVSLSLSTNSTKVIKDNEQTYKGYDYEKKIENFLAKAIEEDLFEMVYQPIISTQTHKIISLESLSRLKHPSYGYISPDFFISLAEKNNSISEISVLQFKKVAKFVKENYHDFKSVTVVKYNLSPMELLDETHVLDLIEIVRQSGVDASYFEFEITETVATEYNDALKRAVDMFRKANIKLSLDDFGSGYANLNTVMRIPFSTIKMDRSLLFDISTNNKMAEFYRNIVFMFNNLGFSVISEGVETKEQYDMICTWGVKAAQGYYFSAPVSEKKILQKIKEES